MLEQIPKAIRKYPSLDFDVDKFAGELRAWFEENSWLEHSN